MTANAFGEDRAACFAAGMNDHVVKPVDPESLYTTLLRWLPAPADEAAASAPARPLPERAFESPSATPLVERLAGIDGLDLARGLHSVGGRVEILERVLRSFVETYGNGETALLGDASAATLDRWPALCHSLRGACATIGASSLDEQLRALEHALHGPVDPQRLAASGRHLREDLRELTEQLAVQLGEGRGEGPGNRFDP
jgi:CheY-like chemotaxis protein